MNFQVSETPFRAENQYLVRERIGAGGMGTIYRAFDIQLRRDVALKVLNTLDPVALERFVREREITADLDHPHFVRVLSMGTLDTAEGRRPFYTMPLLRGVTLADLIQRRAKSDEEGGRLRDEWSLARLLQLVQQICLAMESAHARGILHADLKPTNVIVGTYGELYIVDLGLARYVREEKEAEDDAAEDGPDVDEESPAGTPSYMAPEAVIDPGSSDARADIFGVGGILYYILTGLPPRYRSSSSSAGDPHETTGAAASAPSSRELFLRSINGVLVPPDQVSIQAGEKGERVVDVVDPAVTSICMKALARKPGDRYPNLRAMWQELQQYLEGQFERILKREAADLTRALSRQTVPAAIRNYEMAEQGLREKIVQKEKSGRFGLEEKLELFDLLIDKSKIYEQRGDTAAILRSLTRTEPILETALEVLQLQRLRLLIARGIAMTDHGDHAGAKSNFARAIARARAENLDELHADALRGFGVACTGLGTPDDLAAGRKALEQSIALSDSARNDAGSVRSRLALARLLLRSRPRSRESRRLLGEALARAGRDAALRCEVHLALGAHHLDHGEPTPALFQIETGLQFARDIDARNFIREGQFLLGRAFHDLGDPAARAKHFKQALMVRGLRRTDMERRLSEFYALRKIDPAEIGLGPAPKVVARETAGRRAGGVRVQSGTTRG